VHVGSVVDKVASGHVFLRVLRVSPVSIVPSMIVSVNSSITQAILSSRVTESLNNTHNAHLRFIIQSLFKDTDSDYTASNDYKTSDARTMRMWKEAADD
jgi:hypothetical protein